jgi:hypothetical protein
MRRTGRFMDRLIGYAWSLLSILGAGNIVVGIFNFCLGLWAWRQWRPW